MRYESRVCFCIMNGTSWTDIQARLLCNSQLRAEFRSNPAATARSLGLRDEEMNFALTVDGPALERQANLLLDKRYHEVKKILPLTFQKLGDSAHAEFLKYADSNWPSSVEYHLEDAKGFIEWLMSHGSRRLSSVERNRYLFSSRNRRFALHVVPDYFVACRRRPGLQLLLKFGDRSHEFGFYFLLPSRQGKIT